MQKKYIVLIIGVIVLVVLASGCISIGGLVNNLNNGNSNNLTTVSTGNGTYSGNGVSFNYPSNWQLQEENDNGNNIITVTKYESDNSPLFEVDIMPNKGMSDQEAINVMQNSPNPDGWTEISNSTLKIGDKTAYEDIFTINNSADFNETMKMQQIFFIKNGNTYTLIFQAPNSDFNKEKQNFDLILNSFKIQ